jgi:glycine/D-amino acid oxidase-like deaminating enzyme
MTIAVIGGGIQGCSAAIELAMLGRDVVVFERLPQLMDGASRWNEGKIHLGYIYAADRSLRTAEAMVRGAMTFHRRLAAYLERPVPAERRSRGFTYGIHRDSQIGADEAFAHLAAVDRLVIEALDAPGNDYLGARRLAACARIDPSSSPFDERLVPDAIATPEASIDPQAIADLISARVAEDRRIALVTGTHVDAIARCADGRFEVVDRDGRRHGPFEAVVNSSWQSRLALDATLGLAHHRTEFHRYKLALHATGLEGTGDVPTITLMLGAFGDIVNFGNGRLYLSWYPACRLPLPSGDVPSDPEATLTDEARMTVARASLEALAAVVPAVRSVSVAADRLAVRGGHILAWGTTDISDPDSGLHARHAIGVRSDRGYHSIDTGKYGMAPLHAVTVARRIAGEI